MHFDSLPTEIVTQVFLSLPSVDSALALSATCQHFRHVFHSSKRLLILTHAAKAEYGPLDDIVQIVTQNSSQPAHIHRDVPISDALLKQIVATGRVAQKYEEIYPFKKWKTDFAYRRLLTSAERFNLRRALYRLWLSDSAFHNSSHVRFARSLPGASARAGESWQRCGARQDRHSGSLSRPRRVTCKTRDRQPTLAW